MNYKPRHNMAYKDRVRTNEEEEGMARMMEAVRLKRELATNRPLPESEEVSKNRMGVRQGGLCLGLSKGE